MRAPHASRPRWRSGWLCPHTHAARGDLSTHSKPEGDHYGVYGGGGGDDDENDDDNGDDNDDDDKGQVLRYLQQSLRSVSAQATADCLPFCPGTS